ncbi:hypothetical protein GCM10025876_04550 [Demequina litorisediminis]|uniref:Nitrate reductase n=1 Tax=Demequina litorisediminis TaxID=1849022 RepID=A0ABQ6I9W7_9MICO|nr:hypothetical protein GCM10025876_04550 [Demequina litorisediminis]
MIILGAGTNHWFHSDTTYRTFLSLITLTGCQGVNGGGWAHYVGQEKCRPVTGWAALANALDWTRPPRHMITTAWAYVNTNQWKYDALGPDALASPLGEGTFAGKSMMGTLAQSARSGWMPTYPTLNTNSLDLGDAIKASGQTPGEYLGPRLNDGTVKFAVEDPDAPENWPRVLTVWRANLLGSSAKGNEYFLRHLLGTDHSVGAEQTSPEKRPADVVWRDDDHGKARSPRGHRLPHDVHGRVLRHRVPGRYLVREARPVEYRHAPLRARLHPGDLSAVGDQERLRHLPGAWAARCRASRWAISTPAPTWSPRPSAMTPRTPWRRRAASSRTGRPERSTSCPASRPLADPRRA